MNKKEKLKCLMLQYPKNEEELANILHDLEQKEILKSKKNKWD